MYEPSFHISHVFRNDAAIVDRPVWKLKEGERVLIPVTFLMIQGSWQKACPGKHLSYIRTYAALEEQCWCLKAVCPLAFHSELNLDGVLQGWRVTDCPGSHVV